jgi:hypothetical protein
MRIGLAFDEYVNTTAQPVGTYLAGAVAGQRALAQPRSTAGCTSLHSVKRTARRDASWSKPP